MRLSRGCTSPDRVTTNYSGRSLRTTCWRVRRRRLRREGMRRTNSGTSWWCRDYGGNGFTRRNGETGTNGDYWHLDSRVLPFVPVPQFPRGEPVLSVSPVYPIRTLRGNC